MDKKIPILILALAELFTFGFAFRSIIPNGTNEDTTAQFKKSKTLHP